MSIRHAALAALIPVPLALTACGGSDPAPAQSIATTTPLVPHTAVESNVCPGDVVTMYDNDELGCDVVAAQRLDWQVWTDPKYGIMSATEFADVCSDRGGILDVVPNTNDMFVCTGITH
jgi:hypothetical protein